MAKKRYYTDKEFKDTLKYLDNCYSLAMPKNASSVYYRPTVGFRAIFFYTREQQKKLVDWIFEGIDQYDPDDSFNERYHLVSQLLTFNHVSRAHKTTLKYFNKRLIAIQDIFADSDNIICAIETFGMKSSYYINEEVRGDMEKNIIKPALENIVLKQEDKLKSIIFKYFDNKDSLYRGYNNAFIFNAYLDMIANLSNVYLEPLKLDDALAKEGGLYGSK